LLSFSLAMESFFNSDFFFNHNSPNYSYEHYESDHYESPLLSRRMSEIFNEYN